MNRGEFLFKIWRPLCNQEQLCEVICQALSLPHYHKSISGRGSVRFYLIWPDSSNIQEVTVSRKKLWNSDENTFSITCRTTNSRPAAPDCFIREAHRRKLLIIHACTTTAPILLLFPLPLALAAAAAATPSLPSSGCPSHPSLPSFCHHCSVLHRWLPAVTCPSAAGDVTSQHCIFSVYLKSLWSADGLFQ